MRLVDYLVGLFLGPALLGVVFVGGLICGPRFDQLSVMAGVLTFVILGLCGLVYLMLFVR